MTTEVTRLNQVMPGTNNALILCKEDLERNAATNPEDRRLQLALNGVEAALHWLNEEPWNPEHKCFGEPQRAAEPEAHAEEPTPA